MMVKTDAPKYVTVGHAAAMMDCPPWEVVRLVRRDEIRCVEYDGMALVAVSDVEDLGGQRWKVSVR